MVRNASRALKIDVHLAFDPCFDVEIGTFYPENFGRPIAPPLVPNIFLNNVKTDSGNSVVTKIRAMYG